MHRSCRPAIVAALIALPHAALAQGIPDSLEVLEITDADALPKMRACNPRADQAALDGMLQKQAKNDATTMASIVGERAAVVEKGGLWLCVPMSAKRFPLVPLDTLGELAKPQGADAERLKAFHLAIARSLAETGFARALVTFPSTGNANVLFFAVSPEQPGEVAFESRFLKQGEFNADEYALRLEDANVRSITTAGGATRRDLFHQKYPPRQVVDGYLIRKGNERTGRFDFAGTTWKSPTALATTFSFQKEGVVVYRGKAGTSFGSWKVADGVLYFEINKYSYYSAVLDERDYLNAEARNTPRPLGALAGTAPRENRFKTRFFQDGNAAAEKEAIEKQDNAFKLLQSLLAMRKGEILAESAEEEQRQQAGGRKFQTLCDGTLLPAVMALAEQKGVKTGDLCMSFAGSRSDWKSTILKDGCQGRCLPF